MSQQSKAFNIDSAPLDGVNLVEASAGTGKTYNIEALFVRLVIEKGHSPDEILVVTFTEAATKELRSRIRARMEETRKTLFSEVPPEDFFLKSMWEKFRNGEIEEGALEHLQTAIQNFDQSNISTIHSFARSVLQEYAFSSGSELEMEFSKDVSGWVRDAMADTQRKWYEEAEESESARLAQSLYLDSKFFNQFKGQISKQIPLFEIDRYSYLDIKRQVGRWNSEKKELEAMFDEKLESEYRSKGAYSDSRTKVIKTFLNNDLNIAGDIQKKDFFEDADKMVSPKKQTPELQEFFSKFCDLIHEMKAQGRDFKHIVQTQFLKDTRNRFEKIKASQNLYSYDDMLTEAEQALIHSDTLHEDLGKKFKAALIDEFQDTDPVQWSMFSTLFADSPTHCLYLIGDPKQAIYGFRGADITTYHTAADSVKENRRFTLATNYRSESELVEAVNELFSFPAERPFRTEAPVFFKSEAHKKSEEIIPRFHLSIAPDIPENKNQSTANISRYTAGDIYKILNPGEYPEFQLPDGEYTAGDIAVLVYTHVQASRMKRDLLNYGIKSVTITQESVFKSQEAEEMRFVMNAMLNPKDTSALATLFGSGIYNWSAAKVRKFLDDEMQWTHWAEHFSEWRELWEKQGFMVMMTRYFKQEDILKRLSSYPDGERKLTNYYQLTELLEEERRSGGFSPQFLYDRFMRLRNDEAATEDSEADKMLLESDEDLVKIMTIHNSKGLQFPVVFVPFASTSTVDTYLPYEYIDTSENPPRKKLDVSGYKPEHELSVKNQTIAEKLRLFYVAVTRAKKHCFVHFHNYAYSNRKTVKTIWTPVHWLFGFDDNQNVSYKEFAQNLEDWGKSSPNCRAYRAERVWVDTLPTEEESQTKPLGKAAREFPEDKKLKAKWLLSSYSGLTRNMKALASLDTNPREDEEDEDAEDNIFEEKNRKAVTNIFEFPKGARTGNFWHDIFENLDFSDSSELPNLIQKGMVKYGFEGEELSEITLQMVERTIAKRIIPDTDLKLSNLSLKDTLREMEFYISAGAFELKQIVDIIQGEKSEETNEENSKIYLKGLIDLVFRHNDQYYILDYKSNYLGSEIIDYLPQNLEKAMSSNNYDVQYHLYTLALHRYLEKRLPNYEYEQHFGGVIYLYLRGINEENQAGIFLTKPDKNRIVTMDEVLR